ncbi:hypothetical protein BN1080_02749 [Planococcus massiliensis]|uniref:DUF4179 domain-containing protein n=1 Tax=Planococcus massiliensis TaxID=1499687 RepID=A0A098EPL6_9BACL|nr:DUF4179 domain-containing protein [Planococcus massiliensis]CEG23745.1 hypothetical protein BN1080_02749 [Planococcus massiliensis]
MNGKENSIKEALENIEVPEARLDAIIEESFWETSAAPVKEKRRNRWMPAVATAVLVAGISAATLSATPALAHYMAQLPVIGSVFSIFAENPRGAAAFEEFSEDVALTQTSNGITISIDEAVYDGTKLTFTYRVASEEPLASSAYLTNSPQLLEAEGPTGGMQWEIVDGAIVGISEITHLDEEAEFVNVIWEPQTLYTEEKEIPGDWKFEFAVKQLKQTPVPLDEKVSSDGVTIHLQELTITDVAVNIAYQQLVDPAIVEAGNFVEAELIAKDNLGNVYEMPYSGGSTPGDALTAEDFEWTASFSGLDPNASTLTFYPFGHISGPAIEPERVEFDALQFNLKDGTHRLIEDPTVPKPPPVE